MEVIELDGKRYAKASRAADESGYTTDYVGQLCRAGKVDSRLVGRTWYVKEGALGSHKRGNTRSNRKKTVESFSEKLASLEVDASREGETRYPATIPAYRKRLMDAKITYSHDDAEELPYIKEAKLEVEETNQRPPKEERAEKVAVRVDKDAEKEIAFGATELKQPSLRGSLTVEEADTASEETGSGDNTSQVKDHTEVPVTKISVERKKRSHMHTQKPRMKRSQAHEGVSQPRRQPNALDTLLDMAPGALAVLAVAVFLSGVFLQSVWTYDVSTDPGKYESIIEVAAVGSILEEVHIK